MSGSIITNNAAFVAKQTMLSLSHSPVKKTLHKMIYLIQKAGIDLGYDYHLYFYGPYSEDLDDDIVALQFRDGVEMEITDYGHRLSIDSEVSVSLCENECKYEGKIIEIIKHYTAEKWKPKSLELLATAVYAHEHGVGKDAQSIIAGVKKIKGDKYKDSEIENILSEFEFLGIELEKSS